MTTATKSTMTTPELLEALHGHFIREEDRISQAGAGAVFLTEVTVPNGNRRADAVHVGMWQNRGGGRIDVCELKSSRADWLRELNNPGKAEAWWPHCNAFWLVVSSPDIVHDGELPGDWGLMVPNPRSRRFKVIQKPKEREAKITPGLMVTLLTNTETTKTRALQQQSEQLRRQFSEQYERLRRERGSLNSTDKARLEALDRLEAALGTTVQEYAWEGSILPETAAEALKAFVEGQAAVDRMRADSRYFLRELERTAREAQQSAGELRKKLGMSGE